MPHITYHEAYRFEVLDLKGTVAKTLPRRKAWEATIDGTDIRVVAETRGEAVLAAYKAATG